MSYKVYIESLGCPKNEVDGESMASLLCEKGYQMTEDKKEADVLILNTCGFIDSAKEESIEEIFNLICFKNKDKGKRIIVSGCLTQRYPEELWKNIPEIDGLLGIGDIFKINKLCSSVLEGKRLSLVSFPEKNNGKIKIKRKAQHRPYAYIKIADGCD
ncbi:MAG: 30S ribosomal protein S12 methylthiotransferase RimO, partial [candidate division Zixibacteria bacterium]|nr:30S ribosomal protein S12 methylthiotransferase RimO [candidate division Zixibacteria bacterium]